MAGLTPELEKARKYIKKIAEGYGLDFYETIFEIITYDQMNQFAAFGGFPVRYPHWRFGMEYESLSKGYEYGLSKIYEMVINTDPCYAYLMEGNMVVDQKLVMAHVYGHCDFFKNNQWFSQTNRKMMDTMANHATRIRRYIDRYGIEVVEDFIDTCLSLENLIDRHSPYVNKDRATKDEVSPPQPRDDYRLKVDRDYMDKYINPPDYLQEQREKAQEEMKMSSHFPPQPEKDILKFLLFYAPLEDWQQDILSIIREEAYYFAPQGMTKIMNEGWASYWHTKMMTNDIMNDADVIDYADHHSGTVAMAPNGFNPYKVGIELFRHIEQRWDKGQFGKEWEECTDLSEKKRWDLKSNLGREKIFQVRRDYNDVTFIDEFMTEEFCVENKLFVYKFDEKSQKWYIDTRDFPQIKQQLLFQLTNFGQPIIDVVDANFENRGELLLRHLFEGIEMQPDYLNETMKNLYKIWKRPVTLATFMDKEPKLIRFDGEKIEEKAVKDLPVGEKNEESEATA